MKKATRRPSPSPRGVRGGGGESPAGPLSASGSPTVTATGGSSYVSPPVLVATARRLAPSSPGAQPPRSATISNPAVAASGFSLSVSMSGRGMPSRARPRGCSPSQSSTRAVGDEGNSAQPRAFSTSRSIRAPGLGRSSWPRATASKNSGGISGMSTIAPARQRRRVALRRQRRLLRRSATGFIPARARVSVSQLCTAAMPVGRGVGSKSHRAPQPADVEHDLVDVEVTLGQLLDLRLAADLPLGEPQQLEQRGALARADVEDLRGVGATEQVGDHAGDVGRVDVVADRRFAAEQADLLAALDSVQEGDDRALTAIRALVLAVDGRAAQDSRAQAVLGAVPLDFLLAEEVQAAVGADRHGGGGLGNRQGIRLAVDRATGRDVGEPRVRAGSQSLEHRPQRPQGELGVPLGILL